MGYVENCSMIVPSLSFISHILLCRSNMVLLLHVINLAVAKIPIGLHTVCACIAACAIFVILLFLLRTVNGTIVPFETMLCAIPGFVICDILFGMIKFIPVKDKRTDQTKRWALGT